MNPATVSRALNGQQGVSEKKRHQIIAYSKKMGYRPNALARSLITKQSKLIGLILPDLNSPYYARIASGANDYAIKHGYNMILCNSARSRETERQNIEILEQQRVDGIIIVSLSAMSDELTELYDLGIKVVQADNIISPRFSSIINNNYAGAYGLFEHMIKCECSNIACILGNPNTHTTRERHRAFNDVMKKHGLSENKQQIVYADSTFESGYKLAASLLDKGADSIFCINDIVALGVLKYCQDNHISVPNDVKVAGYDDLEISGMINIPLTTVHQQKHYLGVVAAKQLIMELETEEKVIPVKIELEPYLVARESCGEKLIKGAKTDN